MIKTLVTDEIILNIKRFIKSGYFNNLDELEFQSPYSKALIYPTNDVLLYEHQFEAVKSIINDGETLNVMQMGYCEGFFSPQTVIYRFEFPADYDEYSSLPFDTISLMFPDSMRWILFIDESLEGGEGLLVGDKDTIKEFNNIYDSNVKDILRFVIFHIKDHQHRNVGFDHTLNILQNCYDETYTYIYDKIDHVKNHKNNE